MPLSANSRAALLPALPQHPRSGATRASVPAYREAERAMDAVGLLLSFTALGARRLRPAGYSPRDPALYFSPIPYPVFVALALWRYRLPSAHFARRLEAPARGNPSRRMTFRLFARSSDPAAFAVIYRRITQYHSITASSGKHRRDVETVGSAKPVRADVTCAQPGRPVACVRVPRVLARDCVILPSMLATLCPAWLPCELQVGRLVGVSFWFFCWFLSFLDFLISCSQFKSCLQVFCSSLHLFFLS